MAGVASRVLAEEGWPARAKPLPGRRASRWWAWSWGRERPIYVLVAETEAGVRRAIAATLREAGYAVVEAQDGPDLVDLLRAWYYPGTRAAPVDVIVANADLFPRRASGDPLPAEASHTPVLWIGGPRGPGAVAGAEGTQILAAVDRLVGRGGPP